MRTSLIKLIILILAALNCGCLNNKVSATMEFRIEISKSKVIIQESIPISFHLVNNGSPVDIPLDYKSSDVVRLSLFDHEENLVARSDGYMKLGRLDPPVEQVAQEDMSTVALGTEQAMEWGDNLLRYMDITTPGRYFVQARFQFHPGDVSLESQRIPLEVRENNCNWMDIVRDQVAMGMMYFVQQHDTTALFQMSSAFEPTTFWEGSVLNLSPGSRPRVSEADFVTQDTFEHDLRRWVMWIEGDQLRGVSLTESEPPGNINSYPMGWENAELAGSPIQHLDGGVSAIVLRQDVGQHRVTKFDFDSEFRNTGSSVLASFGRAPGPLSVASDWFGQIYIVSGNAGGLPLQLTEIRGDDMPKQTMVLLESSFPELIGGGQKRLNILSAFPDVKIYSWPVRAILITALLEHEQGKSLKLIRIPLDTEVEGSESVQPIDVPLNDSLLSAGENVVAADMAQTQKAELHAIFSTSTGNIFYVQQGAEPQKIVQIDPGRSALSRIIISGRDNVYLFFPTEKKGIGHQLLYKKVRR